jgi:hypothetical protein
MKMRVFFAIEFDDSIKEYIEKVQNTVRENSIKGNFSHEDNFHLTQNNKISCGLNSARYVASNKVFKFVTCHVPGIF